MKQKKTYDTKKLYLQGLLAWRSLFGVKWTKSPLTKKQQRGRAAFKRACRARRLQRAAS